MRIEDGGVRSEEEKEKEKEQEEEPEAMPGPKAHPSNHILEIVGCGDCIGICIWTKHQGKYWIAIYSWTNLHRGYQQQSLLVVMGALI